MSKRQRILTWTVGVCLVAFAVMAANPSFQQFSTKQFSVGGNQVRLVYDAGTTNFDIANLNGTYALGVSNLWQGPTAGIAKFVDANGNLTIDVTDILVTIGTNLTLTSQVDASAANVLMQNIGFVTNALNSSSAIDLSRLRAITNMGAGLTFTGVANTSSTRVKTSTLILNPNGSDRTLTLPANWKVSDAVRTITVTNGVIGYLTVECFGNVYTSAVYRAFY